jgi:tetrapyrrole methylase family protein / MazG family protein
MIVLDIDPFSSDLPELPVGCPIFHANRACCSFDLFEGVLPYPGSATLPQNAVVLVPTTEPFTKLAIIMDILQGPDGCPWDKKQTHDTLKKYLLEETYEAIDAIDRQDFEALAEELGDVILQPVFHMTLADKNKTFAFSEPLRWITDKLIRRHPHVFGNVDVADEHEVMQNWDAIKKQEKEGTSSILQGVPNAMPALARAHEISKRAVRAGFEWPDFSGVQAKVQEELVELEEAIQSGDKEEVKAELGDLLFTLVNIARWQGVDAEDALRSMLNRFQSRFQTMESLATKQLTELTFDEWDELWNQAKARSTNIGQPNETPKSSD